MKWDVRRLCMFSIRIGKRHEEGIALGLRERGGVCIWRQGGHGCGHWEGGIYGWVKTHENAVGMRLLYVESRAGNWSSCLCQCARSLVPEVD
jgi:hypothetical protein